MENKTETIRQSYDYTFLSDLLEMVRGTCFVVHSDKILNRLFMAVVEHINSCIPVIEKEIIDFSVSITVKN